MLKRLSLVIIILLFFMQPIQAAIILGNPTGNVTLTFIYDYQCIHCHRTFNELLKLLNQKPNFKIRLIPVVLLNEMSLEEAELALTALNTPYFKSLNLILMHEIPRSPQELKNLLLQFQLNPIIFHKNMNDLKVKIQLEEDQIELKKLQSQSVPLILITSSYHKILLKGEQNEFTINQAINYAMVH